MLFVFTLNCPPTPSSPPPTSTSRLSVFASGKEIRIYSTNTVEMGFFPSIATCVSTLDTNEYSQYYSEVNSSHIPPL